MVKKVKKLSDQKFDDLKSAVSFTIANYPAKGSENFRASLKVLLKDLWRYEGIELKNGRIKGQ